jgi:hypothetical protein
MMRQSFVKISTRRHGDGSYRRVDGFSFEERTFVDSRISALGDEFYV